MDMVNFEDGLNQAFGSIKNNKQGFGTNRDPFSHWEISGSPVFSTMELEELYRSSNIIAKAIQQIPMGALKNDPIFKAENDKIEKDVINKVNELNLFNLLLQAWIRARLYGSAYLILNIDDGNDYFQPVEKNKIKSIDEILISDINELKPANINFDGSFEKYQLINHRFAKQKDLELNKMSFIHRDRVLELQGKPLFGYISGRNDGIGDSVIKSLFFEFIGWQTSLNSVSQMLSSHSLFTYKIEGLKELALSNDTAALQKRFESILQGLSTVKGLILDSETEDASFISRNYGGVSELLKEMKSALASAVDLPYSMLWGSPEVNAFSESGKSDRYEFARLVHQQQNQILLPVLNKITRYIVSTMDNNNIDWFWEFQSALELTHKEEKELQKIDIEKYKIQIESGIIHPMEIRENLKNNQESEIELNSEYDNFAMETASKFSSSNNKQQDSTFQTDVDLGEISPVPNENNENNQTISQRQLNQIAEIKDSDIFETVESFKQSASITWRNILNAQPYQNQ